MKKNQIYNSLINHLVKFAYGQGFESLKIDNPVLKNIQYSWQTGILQRVYCSWSEQRTQLITFAKMDKGILQINKLFCTKKEIKEIKANLKVPYEFVKIGIFYM